MRPTEGLGGGHHVAGIHTRPDVGRRERDAVVTIDRAGAGGLGHQGHPFDRKTEPFTGLAQQRHVARRLLAEGEVLPDHHLHHVQALHEQLMDVALGGEFHEVRRERHDQKDVDAGLLDQFGAPGQGGQLCGMAAREHHFHRMRVEGHQHRGHPARTPRFDRVADQFGMPAVNTVEHTDGQHAPTPVRGDVLPAPPPLHSPQPTAHPRGRLRPGCTDQAKIA